MLARHAAKPWYRLRIGNREIVGPSVGVEGYIDRVDRPCPSIRFKEPTPEIDALREKEKGSWKSLTIDEKKKLYRHSFCQTLAEVEAPNAHWKRIVGNALLLICVPITMYALMKRYLMPPLPESMSDYNKKRQVRWYIEARVDPMDGISSKWDYEKNQWKEKPYPLLQKIGN